MGCRRCRLPSGGRRRPCLCTIGGDDLEDRRRRDPGWRLRSARIVSVGGRRWRGIGARCRRHRRARGRCRRRWLRCRPIGGWWRFGRRDPSGWVRGGDRAWSRVVGACGRFGAVLPAFRRYHGPTRFRGAAARWVGHRPRRWRACRLIHGNGLTARISRRRSGDFLGRLSIGRPAGLPRCGLGGRTVGGHSRNRRWSPIFRTCGRFRPVSGTLRGGLGGGAGLGGTTGWRLICVARRRSRTCRW